jgi:RNA 3'-terminal phosphate cyclase (ATP)
MLQALLPTMIFADGDSKLKLKGGTNVNKSPPAPSVQRILIELMTRMGVQIEYQILKEGYFKEGRGEIEVIFHALTEPLRPIELLRRSVIKRVYIEFIVTAQNFKFKDALKVIKQSVKQSIKKHFGEKL